jgi:hypothetical protein
LVNLFSVPKRGISGGAAHDNPPPAEKRLESGIRAHREIGLETSRVLYVDSVRVVLLLVLLVLAAVLIAQFAGATLVPRP